MLTAIQAVAGVVEKRHVAPILANLRIEAGDAGLVLTATDQEVELTTRLIDVEIKKTGSTTASAKKLLDLCRSLPGDVSLTVGLEGTRLVLESGSFKSHLSTLPTADFPLVTEEKAVIELTMSSADLIDMLDRTSFAMAQQDVRYFFNGMLFDLDNDQLRLVATNGQRLATSLYDQTVSGSGQFIVPRKGVLELSRLIANEQGVVTLSFSANHMSAKCANASMISKLIDGTFPDYQVAIPHSGDKILEGNRQQIRDAFVRTAILSNEMYRNVKLNLSPGQLGIEANNPLQEDAKEEVVVDYEGPELEIGFNVSYLIDSLSAMKGERAKLTFTDGSSAVLVVDPQDESANYVISPMVI